MTEEKRQAVVNLRLTAGRAQKIINELAMTTGKVGITTHALERLEERGLTTIDLYRVLQKGSVLATPQRSEGQEWKCKVIYRLRGSRDAGAVTLILENGRLLVLTVEWKDWRN